jgi:hypothetical protein
MPFFNPTPIIPTGPIRCAARCAANANAGYQQCDANFPPGDDRDSCHSVFSNLEAACLIGCGFATPGFVTYCELSCSQKHFEQSALCYTLNEPDRSSCLLQAAEELTSCANKCGRAGMIA